VRCGITLTLTFYMTPTQKRINHKRSSPVDKLAEILYGMAMHDQVRTLAKQRGSLEHLFVLISFGDLLGVPVLPPYYSLRLLPFIVPLINNWKRRMLRERDLMDAIF